MRTMNNTYTLTFTTNEMYLLKLGALSWDINQSEQGNHKESREAWAVYMKLSEFMRAQDSSNKMANA